MGGSKSLEASNPLRTRAARGVRPWVAALAWLPVAGVSFAATVPAPPPANAPAGSTVSAALLPDDARVLAESGDFKGALGVLLHRASEPSAVAEPLARLRYADAGIAIAEAYAADGLRERALAELSDIASAFPGADGATYRLGLERHRASIEHAMAEDATRTARDEVAAAKSMKGAGQLDEARALLEQVLARKDARVAGDVIDTARRDELAIDEAKAEEKRPLAAAWIDAGRWGRAIGLSLFYLLGAIGLLALLRMLARAFPRPYTGLEFEDLDASESSRASRGRRLTFEMAARLRSGTDTPRADIDPAEDFDRSGLANVTLFTRDAEPLQDIIAHSEAVKVGPFAVTPRVLYDVITLPFRRPYRQTVRGSFVTRGSTPTMVLEVVKSGAERATHVFEGTSREDLVSRALDFITYQLAGWRASDVWASYRDYREALRQIETTERGDQKTMLVAAVALLESAVSQDPENWTAQFRLGLALRKLGRNRDAVETLRHLERLTAASRGAGPTLGKFLDRNPAFRRVVRYNLGVCLMKVDRRDERAEAKSIFESIVARTSVDPRARDRLEVLARAGQCAVLVSELGEIKNSRGRQSEVASRMHELRDAIGALKDELERPDGTLYGVDPQAYVAATALALNAYGRACYLCDDHDGAETALIASANRNPWLACAHINLAQVYEKRLRTHPELAEEIDHRLSRALELSPDNRKAHHLMAKLYTFGGRRDLAKAEMHYLAAGRHPMTDLNYAQLLEREGKQRAALARLASSLQRFPRPVDFRYELFLKLAASQKDLSGELLRLARLAGSRALAEEPGEGAQRRLEAHGKHIEDNARESRAHIENDLAREDGDELGP